MISILKKEIRSFLSSLIAYVVIAVFLISIGLFMWVLPQYNVFDMGYANMDTLFGMAPWVFIFLISAITMRSFSEEKKSGTIEIITTKPITDTEIIIAKYLANVLLVLFALIPTLLYFYTIYELGSPKGNLDIGAIWGSYIGLLFLSNIFNFKVSTLVGSPCIMNISFIASAFGENKVGINTSSFNTFILAVYSSVLQSRPSNTLNVKDA